MNARIGLAHNPRGPEPDDELQTAITQDEERVSFLIGDDCRWLCDAVAHAMNSGDWLYVQHQCEKHVLPLIRQEAENEAKAAKFARGEALAWAREDAA